MVDRYLDFEAGNDSWTGTSSTDQGPGGPMATWSASLATCNSGDELYVRADRQGEFGGEYNALIPSGLKIFPYGSGVAPMSRAASVFSAGTTGIWTERNVNSPTLNDPGSGLWGISRNLFMLWPESPANTREFFRQIIGSDGSHVNSLSGVYSNEGSPGYERTNYVTASGIDNTLVPSANGDWASHQDYGTFIKWPNNPALDNIYFHDQLGLLQCNCCHHVEIHGLQFEHCHSGINIRSSAGGAGTIVSSSHISGIISNECAFGYYISPDPAITSATIEDLLIEDMQATWHYMTPYFIRNYISRTLCRDHQSNVGGLMQSAASFYVGNLYSADDRPLILQEFDFRNTAPLRRFGGDGVVGAFLDTDGKNLICRRGYIENGKYGFENNGQGLMVVHDVVGVNVGVFYEDVDTVGTGDTRSVVHDCTHYSSPVSYWPDDTYQPAQEAFYQMRSLTITSTSEIFNNVHIGNGQSYGIVKRSNSVSSGDTVNIYQHHNYFANIAGDHPVVGGNGTYDTPLLQNSSCIVGSDWTVDFVSSVDLRPNSGSIVTTAGTSSLNSHWNADVTGAPKYIDPDTASMGAYDTNVNLPNERFKGA